MENMRYVCVAAVLGAFMLNVQSASAQTPAPTSTQTPAPAAATSSSGLFLGGTVGISAVENVGALAGGELGYRITDRVDILGEGFWMQDVVTRQRLDEATSIATYLQNTQGKTASGTVKAPAFYLGGAIRYMFTDGRVRPYVVGGGGVGWITLQPAFTLGGSDVTSSLSQYNVVLGSDLTGKLTEPAFTAGAGVRMFQSHTYFDAGFRVTSIRTADQTTNVKSASATFGFLF